MEARAIAKYNRQSARKMRLVVDLIRGKPVGEAYAILQFSKKRRRSRIDKTLRSAVANAQSKAQTTRASTSTWTSCS
jgi:large subunit ribosomal protein L22